MSNQSDEVVVAAESDFLEASYVTETKDDEMVDAVTVDAKTKYHYLHFCILGIASLLPFNCIIVPVEFWVTFYPENFLSIASMSYNATSWFTLIFMILKGYQFKPDILIRTSLIMMFIILILIPMM